jgi:transcriptional regulator
MYLPKHFSMTREDSIAVMKNAGVAQLVTITDTGLTASTLPLLFVPAPEATDAMGSLHGHVARANPVWRESLSSHEALVLFERSDAYVSPTAYPSKFETGKVVPTWNYVSVHAHGTLLAHDDHNWTRNLVRRLTEHHEAVHASSRASNAVTGRQWSIDDAPTDYLDAMVKAIVGIEVVLTRIEGKAKLSQNRSAEDIAGVIADLEIGSTSEQHIASAMRVTNA